MGARLGGSRRKTRQIMLKDRRKKGKLSLRAFFQELKPGQKVSLKAEPSYHKGLYCIRRFHGKVCVVDEKVGTCYRLLLDDHGKRKTLIVHPVHLKLLS